MASMPQPKNPGTPEAVFRSLQTIHRAFAGVVLITGVLVFLMRATGSVAGEGLVGPLPLLRPLFWLAALGCLVAIQRIRGHFLSPEALRQRAKPIAQSIVTWHVTMFGLADAIILYGLLLFLLAGLLGDFLLLAGVALGVFVWLRPTQERTHALLQKAERP
ncbi:MAG: hypothetical protein ACE5IQ_13365 [Candidatus Methylomirabilales bacterium]